MLRSMGDVTVAAEQFLEMAGLASAAGRVDDEARAWLYAASALSWFDGAALSARRRARRASAGRRSRAARARRRLRGLRAADLERVVARTTPRPARARRRVTRASGDLELYGFHVGRFVHVQTMRGDYAGAALTAESGLRLAGAAADTYDALMCRFWHGWAMLFMGAWDEMRTLIDRSMKTTEQNGHRRLSLLFRLELAWLHEEAGEFEQARLAVRAGARAKRARPTMRSAS